MTDLWVYDDQYTGARWRYAQQFRPFGYGHQPPGFIMQSDRGRVGCPYGVRDWPRPLTDEEVATYQLRLVEIVS